MNKILIFLVTFSSLFLFSQDFKNIPPPDYIKGIQLFNPVTQNQSPFIGENDYFILSFDDLNSTYARYYYFIKHFDRNWQESDLFESQYVDGYFNDDFREYKPSYNTLQNYVHYEMKFPNERMRPKLSGNYALYVYTKDKKNPLFSVKFSVFENQTIIGVLPTVLTKSYGKGNQRVQVLVQSAEGFDLNDNIQQTSLTIVQNNDWNESIMDIAPQFTFNNRLEFNQLNLVFDGGNEYNWFDTKSLENRGLTTQNIDRRDLYYAFLFPDVYQPNIYDYNPDVDGAFYIRRNDLGVERNPDTEADYVHVNFALAAPFLKGKKVFVVGAFNRYECTPENEMLYDENGGFYTTEIVLKQGYYNYKYVSIDEKGNKSFTLDGNFWETENTYTALLYHRDFNLNYDRLIGLGEQIFTP